MSAVRLLAIAVGCVFPAFAQGGLPAPLAPPQNPTTPARAVLGKLLFWDEQLSSSGRVACGTCHRPEAGGGDPRRARHPGPDGLLMTPDDRFGSPGIERRDASGSYQPHPAFGFGTQVTGRAAPALHMAPYFQKIAWDGGSGSALADPVSGTLVIPTGAALESQALRAFASTVEMGREGRTWAEIVQRVQQVRPLALARDLPPDVASALAASPTYPQLFLVAFGDAAISPSRIAMALAAYQRTTVPGATPWDAFMNGDPLAMTANQVAGWDVFRNAGQCSGCHTPGLFTDQRFRGLGLVPVADDPGRAGITGRSADGGLFKVPSLRNVGLKSTFMHNGRFSNLTQVIGFYRNGGGTSGPRDPSLQTLSLDPVTTAALLDFVGNALVDPRARNRLPPFDRPTLLSENEPVGGNEYGMPTAANGVAPRLLAAVPAYLGNGEFVVGAFDLPTASHWLALAGQPAPPGSVQAGVSLAVDPAAALWLPMVTGAGNSASMAMSVPVAAPLRGPLLFGQVFSALPAGSWAATRGASLPIR